MFEGDSQSWNPITSFWFNIFQWKQELPGFTQAPPYPNPTDCYKLQASFEAVTLFWNPNPTFKLYIETLTLLEKLFSPPNPTLNPYLWNPISYFTTVLFKPILKHEQYFETLG